MKKIIYPSLVIITLFIIVILSSCLSQLETHLTRAAKATANGDYNTAISELNIVIEIDPEKSGYYSARGSCYYKTLQYYSAIEDFTKAIELGSFSSDHDYNNRGLSYFAIGEYTLAIPDFTKAIELSPNPLYYNNLGLVYNDIESYSQALEAFTLAIKISPQDVRFYSNRADTYIALKQVQLAINDLNIVIELSADSVLKQSAEDRLSKIDQ